MMSLPVWLPGPMFLLAGLCSWSYVPSGRVLYIGGLCPGGLLGISIQGVSVGRPPRIRNARGTHPTGMLSCWT